MCAAIGTVHVESERELPVTSIATLLDRCGAVGKVPGGRVIEALRTTALKRIEAVTSVTRRSRYAHGARLAVCVAELQEALGDRAGAAAWIERVRRETKGWPRFQAELVSAMGTTA